MVLHLAAQHDVGRLRQLVAERADLRVDVVGHGAQVPILHITVDVDQVLAVVVIDHGRRHARG